jgi:hypothetical protein
VFEWTPTFWQGWREAKNPYRQYKSERDRYLALEALRLRDGDRVLEVSCGYGWISQALLESAKVRWVGMNNALSPFSVPVRLKNHRKNSFIQHFWLPGTYRHYLRVLGVRLLRVAGDGLFATVPLTIGRFCFPPKRAFLVVRSLDEWAVQRFAWLAYKVWFMAAKVASPCRS